MMKKRILISLLSDMTALSCLAQTGTIDEMILGNKVSEESHALSSEGSEIITGGLDEPARRLLPLSPASWDGGAITFTMKVDPDRQNYVTTRLGGPTSQPTPATTLCCMPMESKWVIAGKVTMIC